jgi:hypothetical protein
MGQISCWFIVLLIYWTKHNAVCRNTEEALLITRKEVGLEINSEKTKYIIMSPTKCRRETCHEDNKEINPVKCDTVHVLGMTD